MRSRRYSAKRLLQHCPGHSAADISAPIYGLAVFEYVKLSEFHWISYSLNMIIFVTGATGFVGSAVVQELIKSGHKVIGLTHSESKADALRQAGVEPLVGDITDLELLAETAKKVDGIVHLAFGSFAKIVESCQEEADAIIAFGNAIKGTSKPLVATGVIGLGKNSPTEPAVETVSNVDQPGYPRVLAEIAAKKLAEQGVNVSVVRLSQIHNTEKQGLVTFLAGLSKEKGHVGYVGDGKQKWAACHVTDTARLYRLALEEGTPGAHYHAVAEDGVPVKDIAEAVGKAEGLPVASLPSEKASDVYGFLSYFLGSDVDGTSKITQSALGWHPEGRTLLQDIAST